MEGTLTVHGLQSDQTRDKVVKVHTHVVLGVTQDDQLEQVVGQFEAWKQEQRSSTHLMPLAAQGPAPRQSSRGLPADSSAILIS